MKFIGGPALALDLADKEEEEEEEVEEAEGGGFLPLLSVTRLPSCFVADKEGVKCLPGALVDDAEVKCLPGDLVDGAGIRGLPGDLAGKEVVDPFDLAITESSLLLWCLTEVHRTAM